MDKYTLIVTGNGQIYTKIWKSRILDVRRRAPRQNESFFDPEFDFRHPGRSNPWKMTIFIKSVRLDKQSDTAEYCFPSRTESKNRRSGPPRMTSENPKHLKSPSPIYIYIDIYIYYLYIYIYIIYRYMTIYVYTMQCDTIRHGAIIGFHDVQSWWWSSFQPVVSRRWELRSTPQLHSLDQVHL